MARFGRVVSPGRPFPGDGDVEDWSGWLAQGLDDEAVERIRRNTMTGRLTGSPSFVAQLEALLGYALRPLKRGRKQTDKEGYNKRSLPIKLPVPTFAHFPSGARTGRKSLTMAL